MVAGTRTGTPVQCTWYLIRCLSIALGRGVTWGGVEFGAVLVAGTAAFRCVVVSNTADGSMETHKMLRVGGA